ncbi:FIG00554764: hypothetical protein [Cronobacter condimenti 1330]|uniref:DUF1097 domain-containing protein n=1 Tax=Cronobacter condimenti 1330 TaxID=1073999 RepID=K8AAT7_9ENTR|nr:DUF1097 domain-containing protein [Cronobacter condimenti]ALB62362.1 hypothetical protein AFK62_07540 [Cronobacter condimenti 1330]CCJ71402.1 FIG00554764: hypothetical protein [Cronobacter condimenti 1330]
MNRHFSLAFTTGLLSALWAWAAVALGLPSWAGFLGCTAWFASPKGGISGFLTILFTLCSGVLWAQVIIAGSAMAPALSGLSYAMTGVVAFLMCMQARQALLAFVPGTFIGACATFAGQGDWKSVVPALLLGLLFGVAMKCSGNWLGARHEAKKTTVTE